MERSSNRPARAVATVGLANNSAGCMVSPRAACSALVAGVYRLARKTSGTYTGSAPSYRPTSSFRSFASSVMPAILLVAGSASESSESSALWFWRLMTQPDGRFRK